MIVVGSSSQGYKTASEYLVKTNLRSASMTFFPHIQSHLIRDAVVNQGKSFELVSDELVILPGTFYIASRDNFKVGKLGYSGGLHYRFSIKNESGIKRINLSDQITEYPIDDHFRAMYDAFGKNTICIILRGSGDDGVESARYIHNNGGNVIISSLRGGMTEYARWKIPDAEVLDPKDMPHRLEELINS